jgi:hypothetical protein
MALSTKSSSSHTIKSVKILECVCNSDYQDSRYGKNKRVHNPNKDGYKCTVCGRPRTN